MWLFRRKITDIISEEDYSNTLEVIEGGNITSVPEFYAGSCHCGIRKWKDDLSIIFTPLKTTASAVFTTNRFKAAPVKVDKEQLKKNRNIQAVVINSGISNACTGSDGYLNALETIKIAAKNLGIEKKNILVSSTGRVGVQLPMEKIKHGIEVCSKNLTKQGGRSAAKAILTIDKKTKEIAVRLKNHNPQIIIGGIAKGSVMIEPDMATTLAFLTTNAKINKKYLDKLLKEAVSATFNCLTTDGCQSTNDMIIVVANGHSGIDISKNNKLLRSFKSSLYYVLDSLAKKVVEDAEGATKIIEIEVINSRSTHIAKNIGKKVANSLLFKTAMYGQDLNWGRIAVAIGSEGSEIDQEKVDLYFGDELIMKNGSTHDFDRKKTEKMMRESFLKFKIDMNAGKQRVRILTNDITYDYIKINAEYRKQR
jgi:glutamate N-acetyltransferase/amino-acid N-acetyltransferase